MTEGSPRPAGVQAAALSDLSVFVVDDHQVVLDAVAAVIEATPGLSVAGTSMSGSDALSQVADRADTPVLLVDVNLGEEDGVEIVRRDRPVPDADALAEFDQVRRGEETGAPSGGLEAGVGEGAGRAFPVGAGDVDDLQRFGREVEGAEELPGVLQAELGAGPDEPEEPADGMGWRVQGGFREKNPG